MAEERIDIAVTDKGADRAAANIRLIGVEAERSEGFVARLRLQLATINPVASRQLAAASNANSAALLKESMAAEKLATARARTALVEQQVATEMARTTAATANAERAALSLAAAQGTVAKKAIEATAALETESAAQARIAAMVDASLAKQAASTASAGNGGGLVGSRSLAAAQAAQLAAGSGVATKALRETEEAAASLGRNSPGFFASFKTGAMGAFDAVRDFVSGNGSRFGPVAKEVEGGLVGVGAAAAKATPHLKGTSTAMRETLVLMREAGRGDFTRMAGSATILAGALGLLQSVVIPLVIVLGTLAAGIKLFQMSISSDVNPKLKEYAGTLGLTSKEMRKLSDEHVNAKGKVEELNVVQLTMMDTFRGFIDTMQEAFSGFGDQVSAALGNMGVNWSDVWDFIKKLTYGAVVGIAASIQTLAEIVAKTFINMGKIIYNAFAVVVNLVTGTIKIAANAAIDGINYLSQKSNSIFGTSFAQIGRVQAGADNLFDGMQKFSKMNDTVGKTFIRNAQGIDRTLKGFGKEWEKNSLKEGEKRLKGIADAIKMNRNPKAPHKTADPKTQADYLADENKKLDDQLRRMNMLKDAREIQEKLDEVEEAFIKRRMPLDKAQLETFRAKFVAIQQGQRQQTEMDRIYEESTGAQQHYNSVLGAANELLKQHAISQTEATVAINAAKRAVDANNDVIGANNALRAYGETLDKIALSLDRKGISEAQATQQTNIAARTYRLATDPLAAMSDQMGVAEQAAKLYGDQVQAQTVYEQARQAMLEKGIVLDATWTKGQNAAVDAIMARNAALQQATYVQSQLGDVLNPILDAQKMVANQANVYAELDRLRDNDLINEEAYQAAKHALWVKYNDQKLNATANFFGQLAQITAHGHGVIGAISKAAAVAEAIIQGFVAAQKALASAPPPFNFIAAAAVGLETGANIAGILSTNVGSYKDGGQFVVGGRSGVDANNINMNVTKGERVTIETAKQQRANDNAPAGAPPEVHVPIKIVNLQSKQEILDHMASSEGERVILNVLSENPQTVRALAGTK